MNPNARRSGRDAQSGSDFFVRDLLRSKKQGGSIRFRKLLQSRQDPVHLEATIPELLRIASRIGQLFAPRSDRLAPARFPFFLQIQIACDGQEIGTHRGKLDSVACTPKFA